MGPFIDGGEVLLWAHHLVGTNWFLKQQELPIHPVESEPSDQGPFFGPDCLIAQTSCLTHLPNPSFF